MAKYLGSLGVLGLVTLGIWLITTQENPRIHVAYFDGIPYTNSEFVGVVVGATHPISRNQAYVLVCETTTGLLDRVIVDLGDNLAIGDTISVTRYMSTGDRFAVGQPTAEK